MTSSAKTCLLEGHIS